MLPGEGAVSAQALCFSYRFDNDGESQPTDIAKLRSAQRLTEKEGGQYQRHVIQPLLRHDDGTTHVDRYYPEALCQSGPAFAQ